MDALVRNNVHIINGTRQGKYTMQKHLEQGVHKYEATLFVWGHVFFSKGSNMLFSNMRCFVKTQNMICKNKIWNLTPGETNTMSPRTYSARRFSQNPKTICAGISWCPPHPILQSKKKSGIFCAYLLLVGTLLKLNCFGGQHKRCVRTHRMYFTRHGLGERRTCFVRT